VVEEGSVRSMRSHRKKKLVQDFKQLLQEVGKNG